MQSNGAKDNIYRALAELEIMGILKKMTIQTIKQQSQSFLSECAICELCHAALIYIIYIFI